MKIKVFLIRWSVRSVVELVRGANAANRENLALAHLERQGFDVWLPHIKRIIRHARRKKRSPPFVSDIYSSIWILRK